eukprot:316822_1
MDKKRIDMLISGYIKEIEKSLLITIVDDIKTILIVFYPQIDKWCNVYSNKDFSIDNNLITAIRKTRKTYNHVYGHTIIKPGEYFSWRLKVNGQFDCVYIGLIVNDDNLLRNWQNVSGMWSWNKGDNGYILNCKHKFFTYHNKMNYHNIDYGESCGFDGDIIEMIFDLTKEECGTIQYIINEKDYGIVYDKVTANRSYRLALCLGCPSEKAQIEIMHIN